MMKIFQKLIPTLFFLLMATMIWSQSNLRKANKQYELYAFNTAIKSYLEVLERQPNNSEALGKLADSYRHLNRLEEAEKWYEKAIRQKNFDEIFLFQYGQVLKGLGKYDQARTQFLKFARNYPVQGNQYAESCKFALARIGDNPSFEIKNEYVNTASSDFGTAFFNGLSVVYSSARRDIKNERNTSTLLGNRSFISRLDANGYLESPILLKTTFGGATSEGNIAYSPDGKMVTFSKNNYVDGTRQIPSSGMELSLFFAEVTTNGDWKNEVPFPYNGSGYSTGFGSFSADGKAIYFASNRPDGFGGYDIYVSYRVGNSWSAPENLGPVVNTQGNEITPFDDGTYLFFASDWHIGFGGFDIFRATRNNTRWDVVEHGGSGLNSSRDDYGFVYENRTRKGYFTSNRVGGKGQEDIYGLGRSLTVDFVGAPGTVTSSAGGSGFPNTSTTTRPPTNTTTPNTNNNTGNSQGESGGTRTLALQIFDSTNGQPIYGAVVDLSTCGEGIQTTNSQGQVFLNRGRAYQCSAFISADGYGPKTINVREYTNGKTGNVPVYINKADNLYIGQVIDRTSGYLLDGILVEAVSPNAPQRYRGYTTPDGKYSLPLKENSVYDVRFSKVGYRDANVTMSTGNREGSKILETVALTSSSAIVDNRPPTNPNVGTGDLGGTTLTPGTVNSNTTGSSGNYSDNNANNTIYGFAVQLAAFAANKSVDLTSYAAKMTKHGQTFIHIESGKQKVRVGLFATKEEAASVQAKARAMGYSGAFTVAQEGGGNVPELIINEATTDVTTNSGSYTPPPLGTGNPINGLNNFSGYVIQIGAFKNAASFSREEVIDIGVVDSFQKDDLTVFVLTGYDTREQANEALRKAKIRGFKTAFLVNKTIQSK